jgi:hypothetical protein
MGEYVISIHLPKSHFGTDLLLPRSLLDSTPFPQYLSFFFPRRYGRLFTCTGFVPRNFL